ncbi:glycosyltransferase [Paenibacillus mesophilus]|uniref:glycosyltransferase family 2 protein n=1 Tax=Paenibacillus mesophilus TaxID=2582849 RepID=UPI00110ECDDB|nr:glycosyltransferase family 2 protein [Paenibacillus mesophilus]TMV53009.1 glycosyltransferase [Paenibacillus mesophilus]
MKISVVMAVYNGAAYLQEAVDSILAQTYDNFEFIIVDDGSTDGTWDILSNITDSRVRICRLPENCGTPLALNIAVEEAEGEWIAVQDADDISVPERLAVQAGYMQSHPELIAVGSKISCVGEPHIDPKRLRSAESNLNYGLNREELFKNRYFVCALCHGTSLYSRSRFFRAGGYDSGYRITHDYDFWLKMFQLGPIEKIDRVLYRYRVHSDSLSHHDGMATYIEKLKCCIRRLRQFEYSSHSDPINLIVFANRGLCHIMANEVVPHCPVRVHAYFDNETHAEYALGLVNNGVVDGIALLQTANRKALAGFFQRKGMVLNNNLFLL